MSYYTYETIDEENKKTEEENQQEEQQQQQLQLPQPEVLASPVSYSTAEENHITSPVNYSTTSAMAHFDYDELEKVDLLRFGCMREMDGLKILTRISEHDSSVDDSLYCTCYFYYG
jgi:hypothetical protein